MAADGEPVVVLPEIRENDEIGLLHRLWIMVQVGVVTGVLTLIPAALLAGSGPSGHHFHPQLFGLYLGGAVGTMLLLCLWTPFARRAEAVIDGIGWLC